MKILIIKIGAIGDVILALPLLRHIRSCHPNCRIDWVCGNQVVDLLRATEQIDQIFSVDEQELYQGNTLKKIWALIKIWSHIAIRRYDLCLTLHADSRFQWISRFTMSKQRRSYQRNAKKLHPIPGRYHGYESIRLFIDASSAPFNSESFAKITLSYPRLKLSISNALEEQLHKLSSQPIIVVSPGGAKNFLSDDALRRWPIHYYVELINQLSALPIYLIATGGALDEWVIPYLKKCSCINWINTWSLLDFIALLQKSSLLITHDSGALHLAKLAHCPALALFGPTLPSSVVGQNEKFTILCKDPPLYCQPCYDGKKYTKCQHNLCLHAIHPKQVFEKALKILSPK